MMNERNILVTAVILIVLLVVISNINNFSGNYVRAKSVCRYIPDDVSNDIYSPQRISYDSDPNDGVPETILNSKCATSTSILSVQCKDGAQPEKAVVQCPTGYICYDSFDGAYCKTGNILGETSRCVDSDGGANSNVKGSVTLLDGRGRGTPEIAEDICATDTTLLETTCASGNNLIKKQIIACQYPSKCVDGACRIK